MSDAITTNRSALKEFIASISAISGDLSNITAPPFLLAEHSTVELPQYWADHPHLFVAPTFEQDPARRALLVLKWFLGSLRNQQYAGRPESEGVKKPLNAFLGELFFASFSSDDEIGETKLLSEQVSHHPPVTACYLWNEKCGIRAEGFTCQEITFSGSVSIKQKGFAVLHLDRFDEDYLIPLPDVKVKGVISGSPYPELMGTVYLVSSTGFVSEIGFEGKGLLRGKKNSVEAKLFHAERSGEALWNVHGQWTGDITIHDVKVGKDVETYNGSEEKLATITTPPVSEQDPWESRRAWEDVRTALQKGNMQGVSDAKSKVEQGQRQMREDEKQSNEQWRPIFFTRVKEFPVYDQLSKVFDTKTSIDKEGGMWKVEKGKVQKVERPFHGSMRPDNTITEEGTSKSIGELNGAEENGIAPNATSMQPIQSQDNATIKTQDEGTLASKKGEPQQNQIEAFLRNKYSSAT